MTASSKRSLSPGTATISAEVLLKSAHMKFARQKIQRSWSRWKLNHGDDGDGVSNYDWGFADGVHSCLQLFLEDDHEPVKSTKRGRR